jgi:hypothetical protein
MELNANWMKRLSEAQREYKFKLTSATQRWAPIPALISQENDFGAILKNDFLAPPLIRFF